MLRFFLSFIVFTVLACSGKSRVRIGRLEASTGDRNQVVLVIEDSLWNGFLGDSIRNKLAAPIVGLPQNESMFDLVQYSPSIFAGEMRKHRNVLQFSTHENAQFFLKKSLYATPQNFFFFKDKTAESLAKKFYMHSDSILKILYHTEKNEELHRLKTQKHLNTDNIKELFACTITIPSEYKLMKESSNHFVWYQRESYSGDVNLVIYEVPINQVENSKGNLQQKFTRARDSVTSMFIKGNKPNSYLQTDSLQKWIIYKNAVQNFSAYQIRGNWIMKNDFMTGPFVSQVIRDDYYQRYLFIEGFVNNPFKPKRNILLELIAIINTTNFYE